MPASAEPEPEPAAAAGQPTPVVPVVRATRRAPAFVLRLVLAAGIVVLGLADVPSLLPALLLWPVSMAACFLGRTDVAVALALAVATLVATAAGSAGLGPVGVVAAALTLGAATLLVLLLRERLERTLAELQRAAASDPVTGLLNPRAFSAALDREARRATRTGLPLCVVAFDLDQLGHIAERYGHAQGDIALRRFALALTEEARAGDVVARMGGTEFTVMLFDADAGTGRLFAERVARRVAAASTHDPAPLTASAGVAALTGADAAPERFLVLAARALAAARDQGGDRVVVCDTAVTGAEPGAIAA